MLLFPRRAPVELPLLVDRLREQVQELDAILASCPREAMEPAVLARLQVKQAQTLEVLAEARLLLYRLERAGTLADWLRSGAAWRQERSLRTLERMVRRQTLLVRRAADRPGAL